MQVHLKLSLGLLLALLALSAADPEPNAMTSSTKLVPCSLHDAEADSCLAKNIQTLFSEWTGSRDTKYDPYHIKEIKATGKVHYSKAIITATVSAQNIVVKGGSQTMIKEAHFNTKNQSVTTKVFIPKLSLDFEYKIEGTVNNVLVSNHDKGHLDIGATTTTIDVDFTPKGKTLQLQHVKVTAPEHVDLKLKLNNLLGGVEEPEDDLHELFHDKYDHFYEYFTPYFEHICEDILKECLYEIFTKTPAESLIDEHDWSELFGENKE